MSPALPLVSPLYAGLVGLLFLVLSYRVVLSRRQHKVSVGDGGEKALFKRQRVQANCAEYAPVTLILLVLAELQGMPAWLVHLFGSTMLAGRLLHAHGFGSTPQVVPARIWGMYLTFATIIALAVANIGHAVL